MYTLTDHSLTHSLITHSLTHLQVDDAVTSVKILSRLLANAGMEVSEQRHRRRDRES